MVTISPLLQLEKDPKLAHPNIYTDAMFPPKAFDALVALVALADLDLHLLQLLELILLLLENLKFSLEVVKT